MILRHYVSLALIAIAICIGGCASNNVRCDSKLMPINAPASRAPAEGSPTEAPR